MSDEVTYFKDPQLDRAVGLVFQLAAELHVTTQRLHVVEALLVEHGVLGAHEVDHYEPDDATRAHLDSVRDAALGRLLRVVTEQGPAEHPLRAELARAPGEASS